MPSQFFQKVRLYTLHFSCLFGMVLVLYGCDIGPDNTQIIDTTWHRQDLEGHLSRWLAVAPTPSGLLLGSFDRQWHSVSKNESDLTTHSRLIFTMVMGYEITGDSRYLEVAVRGTEFLLSNFRDSLHGGFFARVDANGRVTNAAKITYGHAFALLALSHVARVTKEERYRAAALRAWREIDLHLRDPDGGFRPEAPRDFGPTNDLRTQNPVMHMFEALLALVDATGDPQALAGAQSVGHFVLYKLLEGQADGSAYIPEWYNEHWKPLPTRGKDEGGYIDIGHQFEWSHLLADAERRGLPALYGPTAERLLKYALKIGYDEIDGGVFNRAYPDGSVDRDKFWWQQAEGLRALMVAASASHNRDLWHRYEQTLELVKVQLVDNANGGWKLAVKRTCDSGHCGTEQPDPYHLVGMDAIALGLSKAGH